MQPAGHGITCWLSGPWVPLAALAALLPTTTHCGNLHSAQVGHVDLPPIDQVVFKLKATHGSRLQLVLDWRGGTLAFVPSHGI